MILYIMKHSGLMTHRHHKKIYKKNKYTKKYKKSIGGKAIGAGSYGCVFDPPLLCDNTDMFPYNPAQISKLMYKNEAIEEMELMTYVQGIVQTIPNNDKYFLLKDVNMCNPAELSDTDLEDYDKECTLFTKSHNGNNILSSDVNMNLDKLLLINMPNGGMSLSSVFETILSEPIEKTRNELFIFINNKLIELLKNGIIPLNQKGFLHSDIKDDNILVGIDNNVRLIDWSLSSLSDGKGIPYALTNRSVHFNMPVSILLFNTFVKDFVKKSYEKIKASVHFSNNKTGQKELIKIVTLNLINNAMKPPRDSGHFKIIVDRILHSIYKIFITENSEHNLLDYRILTNDIVIEYIQAILLKYVDENGEFDDVRYYYEVFIKNADIWGFILSYSLLIEKGRYDVLPYDLINGLCRIFLKYCFSTEYADKPININMLVEDLSSLNRIVKPQSKTKNRTKNPKPYNIN